MKHQNSNRDDNSSRAVMARQGLLAAVMCMALGACVVVAEQGGPEVDALTAQQALEELLAPSPAAGPR